MLSIKKLYAPFIRKNDNINTIMTDVIIALLPCIAVSYLVFDIVPLVVILVAVGSAIGTELLFYAILYKRIKFLSDYSALITGILLSFTIAPFTPLYVVAFGGAMAVLFGKLLWGGLGRNTFNPALVGRELMVVFFPAIMSSRDIWYESQSVNIYKIDIFNDAFINQLMYKVSGAIGEYSLFLIVLGGIFLLFRRRISWHIPTSLLVTFSILFLIFLNFTSYELQFSIGGLLLGAIFIATDMPSSASSKYGKLYYGTMIGVVALIFIVNGVRYEYMSYSILLLNGFVRPINWTFRPKVWGQGLNIYTRMWQFCVITAVILATSFTVIYLYHLQAIKYLIYAYIVFCIIHFTLKVKVRK